MNIHEAIRQRRSIRRYQEGAVIPEEDIETILEAAMLAPSARNDRPWNFTVVRKRETLLAITELSPYTQMMKSASAAIVISGIPDPTRPEHEQFWPQDCGAAIENMLLEAVGLGYGTCWCGFYPVMERVAKLQTLLEIRDATPLAVIALGVPDEAPAMRGHYEAEKVRFID